MQFPAEIPFGQTRDLILAPIGPAARHRYFRLNADESVMRSYGVRPHLQMAETDALIRNLERGFRTGQMVRWGIFLREGAKELIGDVGFWRFVAPRSRAEAGAKLMPAYQGRGLMVQALGECLRMGFERFGLNSVEGHLTLENRRSMKLVEKLGFVQEGVLREHSYDPFTDTFQETILMSLTKRRWMEGLRGGVG